MGIIEDLELRKVNTSKGHYSKNLLDFIDTHQHTTITQNFSLGVIVAKSFGYIYEPYEVYHKGELIGFIPFCRIKNKLVALPHFSYGSIVATTSDFDLLLDSIKRKLKCNHVEIRGFQIQSRNHLTDKVSSFLYLEKTIDKQWGCFKSKLRSQIRKGYKNQLISQIGDTELLKDFYNVYSKNMHDLGSPVLPITFFDNILNSYKEGKAKIQLIYFKGTPIGGGFIISYKGFCEVCWASTLRKYNYLQPNMVLYWEMISYAINDGMQIFSFGRSTKDSNTFKFKKQWGCKEVQLYFNSSNKRSWRILNLKFLSRIWQLLPFKLTLKLGPMISRKMY